jgi:hypothetical protein
MNRRNAIKAAIGGIAAACGLRVAKAGTKAFAMYASVYVDENNRPARIVWEDRDGNPITNSRGEPMSVELT